MLATSSTVLCSVPLSTRFYQKAGNFAAPRFHPYLCRCRTGMVINMERLIDAIELILIEEGQRDKERFKLGQAIMYEPYEVKRILLKNIDKLYKEKEIVRCKECIHRNNIRKCQLLEGCGGYEDDDWYCADGEREIIKGRQGD